MSDKAKRRYKDTWAEMVSQSVFFAEVAEEKTKIRPCLRCSRQFKSYGPQNRLCEHCRPIVTDMASQYD